MAGFCVFIWSLYTTYAGLNMCFWIFNFEAMDRCQFQWQYSFAWLGTVFWLFLLVFVLSPNKFLLLNKTTQLIMLADIAYPLNHIFFFAVISQSSLSFIVYLFNQYSQILRSSCVLRAFDVHSRTCANKLVYIIQFQST